MKKAFGDLYLFITAMLCLFCVSLITPGTSLKAHAAAKSVTLATGENFNNAIRSLTKSTKVITRDSNGIGEYHDENITKRIDFLSKGENVSLTGLPSKSVGSGVSVYYNESTATIYVYTAADKIYFNQDARVMFYGYTVLEELDFGDKIDTSKTNNMNSLFENCRKLRSLDLSRFNTSKVENAASMFSRCKTLTSLDLRNFKTSKFFIMDDMFYGCTNLSSLNVSSFDTSNVLYMQFTFAYCEKLTSLNISNFKTNKCKSFRYMFEGCYGLKELDLSSFNTLNASNSELFPMTGMFENCLNLEKVNLSNFDTKNVPCMGNMFYGCQKLKHIDLSKFNTGKVLEMDYMFDGCVSLEELDLSSFNLTKTKKDRTLGTLAILNRNLKYIRSPKNMKVAIACRDAIRPSDTEKYTLALDDNADGVPDSTERFGTTIPVSQTSHRYVVIFTTHENPQPEINYDKGPFTLNLTNGSVANEDLVLLSTIVILSESGDITYQEAQSDTFDGAVLFDLNKDGTMDMLLTYSRSSTYYKYQFSAVKAHSIPGTLTLTLSDELKRLAKEGDLYFYNSLTFNFPASTANDPGNLGGITDENAPTVNGEPVKVSSIEKVVTIDGITYIIDKTCKATAIKITSKKKASINTVAVNGKTYPVVAIADNTSSGNKKIKSVTIGSNVSSIGKKAFYNCKKLKNITINANKSLKIGKGAFKKISKDASIKVKGVKGNTRKKLIKAINK